MKELLKAHLNTEIGINIERGIDIDHVTLTAAHDEYFTVEREKDGNTYHPPYLNIVKIIENPEGVTVGGIFRQKKTFPFVVKIGHMVDYLPT